MYFLFKFQTKFQKYSKTAIMSSSQVPRIRIGEDHAVALAQEVADPVVVAATPQLDHVVVLWEVPVESDTNIAYLP